MAIPKRPKKCPECGEKYQPTRPLQPCCDKLECKSAYAIRFAEAQAKRRRMQTNKADRIAAIEDRKIARAKKEKLKTARDWTKEAQVAVNAYRRELLKDEPCISCGRYHEGQYHAGHYMSVGAHPELRFEELNIWKQCQPCNTYLSGNLVNYRKALVQKIGIEKVEWLEGSHPARHYSIAEIKEIIIKYKGLLKELKKNGL